MNVSLTPELEAMVNAKVNAGMYQTASEVIREGLRLLKARDEDRLRLRADIAFGFDQAEQGKYSSYDEQSTARLAAEIKTRGRKRLARQHDRRSG